MPDYEESKGPDVPEDLYDQVDETPEAVGVEEIESAAFEESFEDLPEEDLAPHFKLSEFHCHDGTPVPENTVDGLIRLCVDVLESMRAKFGVCTVSSGFRSKSHNESVGGASSSYHRYDLRPGKAASDVKFRTGTPTAWSEEADRILGNAGGVGLYPTFVHVDNRTDKWRG
jgi:peptidase M15-like protein